MCVCELLNFFGDQDISSKATVPLRKTCRGIEKEKNTQKIYTNSFPTSFNPFSGMAELDQFFEGTKIKVIFKYLKFNLHN